MPLKKAIYDISRNSGCINLKTIRSISVRKKCHKKLAKTKYFPKIFFPNHEKISKPSVWHCGRVATGGNQPDLHLISQIWGQKTLLLLLASQREQKSSCLFKPDLVHNIGNFSCKFNYLLLPRANYTTGKCSLTFVGPKVWSSIPGDIESSITLTFKRNLKKHLLHEKQTQLWTLATSHLFITEHCEFWYFIILLIFYV